MKTEITVDKLRTYTDSTLNFNCVGSCVDYVEVEIIPDGIKKLECNLTRFSKNKNDFTELEWKEINETGSEMYEYIKVIVHFYHKSNTFKKMFMFVDNAYDSVELNIDNILTEEEKQIIIDFALKKLTKTRKKIKTFENNTVEDREIWIITVFDTLDSEYTPYTFQYFGTTKQVKQKMFKMIEQDREDIDWVLGTKSSNEIDYIDDCLYGYTMFHESTMLYFAKKLSEIPFL